MENFFLLSFGNNPRKRGEDESFISINLYGNFFARHCSKACQASSECRVVVIEQGRIQYFVRGRGYLRGGTRDKPKNVCVGG